MAFVVGEGWWRRGNCFKWAGDDDVGDGDDDGDLAYDGVGWVMELELEMEVDGARSKRARVSGSCVVYVFFLAWS